jgi:hypothetical protein
MHIKNPQYYSIEKEKPRMSHSAAFNVPSYQGYLYDEKTKAAPGRNGQFI